MLLDVVKYKNNFISVSGFSGALPPPYTGILSGKNSIVWETINFTPRNDWIKFAYSDRINLQSLSLSISVADTDFDYMYLEKSYDGFDKFVTLDQTCTFNYSTNELIPNNPITTTTIEENESVLLSTATDPARPYKIYKVHTNLSGHITSLQFYDIPALNSTTNITTNLVDELFWQNIHTDQTRYEMSDFINGTINLSLDFNEKIPYFRLRFFNCSKIKITNISIISEETIKENDLMRTYFLSRQRNKMPEIFQNTDLMNVYNTYIENLYDNDSLSLTDIYEVDSITPIINNIDHNTRFLDLQVVSSSNWKLVKSSSWITGIDPIEGFGNQRVRVYMLENTSLTPRTATVTCNDKDENTITSTIIQGGI